MGKITSINNGGKGWTARAALLATLEDIKEDDGIVIIIDDGSSYSFKAANMNNAETLYALKSLEMNMMLKDN